MAARVEVTKFDGKGDFSVWKLKMKALLACHQVSIALEEDQTLWSEEQNKRKVQINEEAFSLILLSLNDNIIRKVSTSKSPIELWHKLDSLFANVLAPNLAYLKASLFAYRMDVSKSVDENLDDFLRMTLLLSGTEYAVDETSLVMILMNAMPDNFQVVKNAFQYTGSVPSYDLLCTALRTRELELKNKSKTGNTLFVKNKGNGKGKSKGSNSEPKGKPDKKSGNKDPQDGKSILEGRKCFYCGKAGHYKKNCYKWLKRNKTEDKAENNLALNDKDNSGENILEVLSVTSRKENEQWILDSGCSYHMCPNKEWFSDYLVVSDEQVFMGDNNVCTVKGKGTVLLKLRNGKQIKLTEVRHIPDLKRNLISLGVLDDNGCACVTECGVMKVYRNGKILLTGTKHHSLYILDGCCDNELSAMSVTNKVSLNDALKWHLRLGHISVQGLEALNKQGIIGNLDNSQLPFCEPCVLAKKHRHSFGTGQHNTKDCLEYLHADLWGPEAHESHGGNRYFLCIVDDYTRMVWTFLIKSKDEVFSKFSEWKILIENQTGNRIKTLRTDNGLEFCNNLFDNLCAENGIVRHRTVRYTPQQNGVAERMNRTLLEKSRSLLFTSGLSKGFWGEALATATYLVNRSPYRALNFKCPIEMWKKHLPNLDHLRVFG